jgi:hypothetical protein
MTCSSKAKDHICKRFDKLGSLNQVKHELIEAAQKTHRGKSTQRQAGQAKAVWVLLVEGFNAFEPL